MKQYFEIFLLLFLFYLIVQLIRSDKTVEGIDATAEDPSTAGDPDSGTPCTVADFNGKDGGQGHQCDTVNGRPIGLKYNDDVGGCDCVCGDGYRTGRVSQGEQGCVESNNIQDFTCSEQCMLEYASLGRAATCDEIDSMKDGCGKPCTVEGGGTEKSETLFNHEMYQWKHKLGCTVSNEEFIEFISGLPALIAISTMFDLPGFTYSSFIQLSDTQKEKMYTDESIMNQNELKNQIIVKLDETCLEGVSSSECMEDKDKKIRDNYKDAHKMTVLDFDDVDDFINFSFKQIVIKLYDPLAKSRTSLSTEEISQQIQENFTHISEFVKLFENKNKFDRDYQEHVGKILEEARKSSDSKVSTLSTTSTTEDRRRREKGSGPSDISPLFDRMVSDELKTMWTVKGLLCRKEDDIDKIHLMKNFQRVVDEVNRMRDEDPEECNKQYCIGNVDITKDHVCPRLKYLLGKGGRIEGNTDDECCDISFFEKILFKLQDLFDF